MKTATVQREPGFFAELAALDGRFSFLTERGGWFWIAIALGLAARLFLVFATEGTTDVVIWADHASGTAARGLAAQYRASEAMLNHPPLAVWLMTAAWRISEATGVDFRICMRLPVALADWADVWLLAVLLVGRRERWLVAALYALIPIALVLGAYHGNTDAWIATLLLGAACCAARGRGVACGVLLGVGLALKLPIVLGAPALVFAFPTWRKRFEVVGVALGTALLFYAPILVQDFGAIEEKVFGYRGLVIFTLSRPPTFVWGLKSTFIGSWGYDARVLDWAGEPGLGTPWPAWAPWLVNHGSTLALALIVVFAFLRRRERDARGIALTVAGSYAIFYALVDAWAFQYFAWSMPFWLLARWPFAWAANVFAGGYIYLLYAFVCSDALLRPHWGFNEHPNWPGYLFFFREAALYTFVVFSILWLFRAVRAEIRGSPKR